MSTIENLHFYAPSARKIRKLNIDSRHSDFQKLVTLNKTTYFAKPTDIQLYINTKVYEKLGQKIHLECCPTLIYKDTSNQYFQLSQSLFSIKKGSFDFADNVLKNKGIQNTEESCLIYRNSIIHDRFAKKKFVDEGLQSLFSLFPSIDKETYLKMIVLDVYTSQKDRHGHNIQIDIHTGALTPLYDNELCLLDKDLWEYYDIDNNQIEIYSNPFIVIQKTIQGMSDFLEAYASADKIFKQLLDTDFNTIIQQIALEDNLNISEEIIKEYLQEEEKTKQFLKTIL